MLGCRRGGWLAVLWSIGAGVPAVRAQSAAAGSSPSTIAVSARGEVQVAPDRVRVQVGVETQARTARVAGGENSRKLTAVVAAIRALGIGASQIRTASYSLSPVERWEQKEQRSVLDGYRASNIVVVETDRLELAGPILDAGLTSGANRIAGLEFLVKDRERAEDAALAQAVDRARRQAQVAAQAAGGEVVELLELTVLEGPRPEVVPMVAMARLQADAVPTPVSEGVSAVVVSVSTRWRFARRP